MRVAIIGAGPAGISASLILTSKNVQVTILDEQHTIGGQNYRNSEIVYKEKVKSLGFDYVQRESMLKSVEKAIQQKLLTLNLGASVWSLTENKEVSWSINGKSFCQKFDAVILATGALERAMPLYGWTNPGVITVGAAQNLMKKSHYSPSASVMVGSGPLFYFFAYQMLKQGIPPKALLETQSKIDIFKSIFYLRPNLITISYLLKGVVMLAKLKLGGVRRVKSVTDVHIKSDDKEYKIHFTTGKTKSYIGAQNVFLHAGIHPNIQITQALGIKHDWNYQNQCWEPRTDKFGRTNIPNILIAGDAVKIQGADSAKISGEIAALNLLADNGFTVDHANIIKKNHVKNKYVQFCKFLDVLYSPKEWHSCPPDDVVICRCEGVTAGEVRGAIRMGCLGPNQLKAFSRCGMGDCQGRYCGMTVVNLFSEMVGQTPAQTGYFRIRSPIKPVTLSEIANFKKLP